VPGAAKEEGRMEGRGEKLSKVKKRGGLFSSQKNEKTGSSPRKSKTGCRTAGKETEGKDKENLKKKKRRRKAIVEKREGDRYIKSGPGRKKGSFWIHLREEEKQL